VIGPGRKSAAAMAAVPPGGVSPARVQPPTDLSEAERSLFCDIVLGARAEHFAPCDVPLLALYCRLLVQADRATAEIGRDMAKASTSLLEVQRQAVKGVYDLAMRLRVSPQGRQGHLAKRSNTRTEPTSYYDRMALERGETCAKSIVTASDWR
jgi:hypothetical protein